MKFRKDSSSSPKMDLLSRRSSTGRLSTFKRTKSFRASVRIMSKIRNHTNPNQSTISPQVKESVTKTTTQWTLPFLQKKQQQQSESEKKNKTQEKIDTEKQNIELTSSIESIKIAKDLKQKLSLTNRIMGKNRKVTQNNNNKHNINKHERQETSKSTSEQLGKSHYSQDTKKISEKREYPVYPTGEYNSYENPTFCLDSSIDSSVNDFFFPVKSDDKNNLNNEKKFELKINDEMLKSSTETLTILVDSKRDNEINNQHFKSEEKEQKYNNYRSMNDEANGKSIVLRNNNNSSRINKINESEYDNTQYELCRVDVPLCEKVTVNNSKFLRPRTVDNITNFWNGGRSSFRVKKINHKKEVQESKKLESIIHDRVSMTTTLGSSRFLCLYREIREETFFFFFLTFF